MTVAVSSQAVSQILNNLKTAAKHLADMNVGRVPRDVAENLKAYSAYLQQVAADVEEFAQSAKFPRRDWGLANKVQHVAEGLSELDLRRLRKADIAWLTEVVEDLWDIRGALVNLESGGNAKVMGWDPEAKAYRKNKYVDEG